MSKKTESVDVRASMWNQLRKAWKAALRSPEQVADSLRKLIVVDRRFRMRALDITSSPTEKWVMEVLKSGESETRKFVGTQFIELGKIPAESRGALAASVQQHYRRFGTELKGVYLVFWKGKGRKAPAMRPSVIAVTRDRKNQAALVAGAARIEREGWLNTFSQAAS